MSPTPHPMHRVAALLMLLLCGVATADEDPARARDLVEAGEILPLEEVLSSVRGERNWRLLEAELEREGGRWIYEFELLDERGRVHEIEVDARSGEILEEEQKGR